MGITGLFQRLFKKGHKADVIQAPLTALGKLENGIRQHVDVQGSIYPTIRFAYSTSDLPEKAAHVVVEKRLKQFASPAVSILYLDGEPALEKQETHEDRSKNRSKALAAAAQNTELLAELIQNGQHVRKHHFADVENNLRKAFGWEISQRQGLVQYLRSQGWTVVESETEADVEIGRVCKPNDIVVSGDSDLLMYNNVNHLWRPWRKGQLLHYSVPDILKMFDLSRPQWTALGIVSANDYGKNISGLGIGSNFGIIKSLQGNDVPSLIQEYLHSELVALKTVDAN
ncbi:hypothetical protein BGX34_000766, partial [Mortierella sp. NVP85]